MNNVSVQVLRETDVKAELDTERCTEQNVSKGQRSKRGRCLVAKSCLTLCDPVDCSPSGSSVHGIL